LRKKDNKKN